MVEFKSSLPLYDQWKHFATAERIFWSIVMLSSAVACIYLTTTDIMLYTKYGVATEVVVREDFFVFNTCRSSI